MSLTELFIRRPVGTLLLALGLFMAGAVAFNALPVASLPKLDMPGIQVSARLPGADPETMAATVAAPLERRLGEIAGVNEITSTSTLGSTSIQLQFDLDRDIDGAARDVQAALNASGGDLPADLPTPPTYRKFNSAEAPILILAVTSKNITPGKLYDAADTILAQSISQIEGVAQVNVSGGEKQAVRVRMNPGRLAAMGVGLEDVRNAIIAANVDRPKGSLDGPEQNHSIGANDQLVVASDYAPIIVKQANGAIVRLSAVASVTDSTENTRVAAWRDHDRAVVIFVMKQADANIIDTVDNVLKVLPQLKSWMPAGAQVSIISDRTITIRDSVRDVEITLMITVVLVVLVVLLSLGRATPTLAAIVTVPLSLAGTFAAMWALDFSLDNISLMALTISVGFVVDDAIVMIENIARHVERGVPPLLAAIKGAREITFTVISISISLVAVFIPLLFMGGTPGRLFHEFAVTLTVAIGVSALVSIVVTPVVYGHLMVRRAGRPSGFNIQFGEIWMEHCRQAYLKGLSWVLRHQGFMLGVMLCTIFATIGLYIVVPKGFMPQQDTGMIMGITEARPDVSFQSMSVLQQQVGDVILSDPAIEGMNSSIGSSTSGFSGTPANTGRMFISLKPLKDRDANADQVVNRLRPKLAKIIGINTFLQAAQDFRMGGRSSKAQFQFALWSDDLDELRLWTPRLINKLKSVPGLTDVSSDQDSPTQEVTVVVDRDAASRLNVDLTTMDNVLEDAFAQRQVSTIYTQRNQYHVILEVDAPYQEDPDALSKIYLPSATGQQVPLSAIAHFQRTTGPLAVTHQGQFPAATLTFNLTPGTPLGEAAEVIQKASAEIGLPSTMHAEFAGSAKAFADMVKNQPLLIGAAFLAIYIVLGILYENLLHPLTIISTLPSAGIGALLALMLTGNELTLISVIGVILLMGIVKKNGIMLVDFAIEFERHRQVSPERAIMEACRARFRPITMTTLAAVLGAVPLALGTGSGAELRRPLGIAIVGGLLVSQVLTLYTTPVVYLALSRLSRRRQKRRAAKQQRAKTMILEGVTHGHD